MTNWHPDKLNGIGPKYVQLADLIEQDIASGTLKPGDKLPPQRNLAYDLGVTIGTIGRAYTLATERGLVAGEIGRGTYVLSPNSGPHIQSSISPTGKPRGMEQASGLYRMNSTSAVDLGQSRIITHLTNEILNKHPEASIDYIRTLEPSWQQAGQQWLATDSWEPPRDQIVPTLGVHAAMLSIIATISAPGEKIAFEEETYAFLARSVDITGRRVVTVKMTEEGIDPEDFARVCAQQHPRALVTVPTLHNPTQTIVPERNREQIVRTAQKYNVKIIEDNIYGVSLDNQPPPMAALGPDITFHLGGLSKSVSAGIRAGWASCPPGFVNRILVAHKMLAGGHSFILAQLAAELVLRGYATEIRNKVRDEVSRREYIARNAMKGHDFKSQRYTPYIWLKLKQPWTGEAFQSAALQQNILIDSHAEFDASRREIAHNKVRIAFASLLSNSEVETAFAKLKHILDYEPSTMKSL